MNKTSLFNFYKQQVEEVFLPFWARALDHENGGIYTCFNNAGDVLISKDKYTWSQGRFVWLWAKTAQMISENKLKGNVGDYYAHLHKTVDFLEERAFLENGNCAFLLTETGEKKDSIPGKGFDTSIYADCFVVLGFAAYARLFKDLKRLEKALGLYDRIASRVSAGKLRTEPYPIPEGYRAHSISMIMLNIAQELADAADALGHGKSQVLYQRTASHMADIMDNFCQHDHRIVEMLPGDPANCDTLLYRHVNPGHTIESMWFVMDAAQKAGNTSYVHRAIEVIKHAMDIGWDPEFGGLLRFVDKDGGRPKGKTSADPYEKQIADSWDLKLWWPHSEALYATLRAYISSKNQEMLSLYEKTQSYVFDTFPNPDKKVGEWIQIRDRQGNPIDKVAALPVKDPFHILRNMLLIVDLLADKPMS